jgi:hypothetical protein
MCFLEEGSQNDLRVDSCAAWHSGLKIAAPDTTTAGSKLHFSVQVKGNNGDDGGAAVDGSMPVECT